MSIQAQSNKGILDNYGGQKMKRTILAIAGTGLCIASLSGCGSDPEENNNQNMTPTATGLCEFLDGRSYYTAGLGEGGITQDGL